MVFVLLPQLLAHDRDIELSATCRAWLNAQLLYHHRLQHCRRPKQRRSGNQVVEMIIVCVSVYYMLYTYVCSLFLARLASRFVTVRKRELARGSPMNQGERWEEANVRFRSSTRSPPPQEIHCRCQLRQLTALPDRFESWSLTRFLDARTIWWLINC